MDAKTIIAQNTVKVVIPVLAIGMLIVPRCSLVKYIVR